MGLLDRGQAALVARMKSAVGRTVTYTRGGSSYQLAAWPGQQLFSRAPTTQNGATVVRSDADYLFSVADAEAAGLTLPPQRGDRITDPGTADDVTGEPKVYEVKTPTGEPHWRYSDPVTRTTVRVHTMRAA